MYDPAKMYAELETAADERAEAEYEAHLLERNGEILLSTLMVKAKESGEPVGICKEIARSRPEWKMHVTGEAVAIQRRSRARAKYQNLMALSEARKTQEVSARTLTR